MEIKEFYLYKNVNCSNQTLGIRKIDFQEPYNLTNVFTEKIARQSRRRFQIKAPSAIFYMSYTL